MSQALSIREALQKYGKVIQPVKGDSMFPMLDDEKDAVELIPVRNELQKYDLPLYQRPDGKLVLHRIIEVNKKYYLTCGDNRTRVEKVPKDWVIAVASGFYKNGAYVSCQDEGYLSYIQEKWKDFPNRSIIKKIPREWKMVMALYRMAITGQDGEIQTAGNLVWETVYNLCKQQMIGAAVYEALDKVNCPEQIREKFKQLNQQSLRRWLLFKTEREKIYEALQQKNIPYMSLKGILYAPLYPVAGMREIADNDVLIRPQDAQTVNRCMTEMGYRCKPGWAHESYHKEPMLNFELHTKLFYNKHIEAAFSDVWNRAKQAGENSCKFLMSDEDIYLHTVAHFHKHYTESGYGLRPFADLYLLKKQGKNYDMQYIDRKLEKMGLREFAAFFEETTHQLFEGDIDAIDGDAVQYIFRSGAFGNVENRVRNGIDKSGKGKYLWSRVFLPYAHMCQDYPCLIKFPILLPIFWVVRLVNSVFNTEKRRRLKTELSHISQSNKNTKNKNG